MKTEFLKNLGIEEDTIKKIMAENGKDVEAEKAKITAAQSELAATKEKLTTYETEISKLKETSADTEKLNAKIAELEKSAADRKAADEKAAADKALADRFGVVASERKFVNDLTKNGIMAEFSAAIADKANTGKADKDILDGLLKDREGILANPNPGVNIPGINNNSELPPDVQALDAMPYEDYKKFRSSN
jgi:DNA-binding transcriptional MerR regulator